MLKKKPIPCHRHLLNLCLLLKWILTREKTDYSQIPMDIVSMQACISQNLCRCMHQGLWIIPTTSVSHSCLGPLWILSLI